jgi:hypothetical protein
MTHPGSVTARQGTADESANLRVYRFDPGAVFEGAPVGAIERLSLGRSTKPLDGLLVTQDPAGSGARSAP